MSDVVHFEAALPHELDAALERAPIAYVTLGTLEWHSHHLPLGTDALKAHGIVEAAARRTGGVVLPPFYFGCTSRWHPWSFDDFGIGNLTTACLHIFTNLAELGFEVIAGVTGHDVPAQVAAMRTALDRVREEHDVDGFVMMEGDLTDFGEHRMDHAGQWESAIMMNLYPELVDIRRLDGLELDGRIRMDEWKSPGIGGRDPRGGAASAELGERFVDGMAEAIANRALELLEARRGSATSARPGSTQGR